MQKHLYPLVALISLFSCEGAQKNGNVAPSTAKLAPPQITRLADLPDSLQPKVIDLQKMPPPQVVPVPKVAGGSYRYVDPSGIVTNIPLNPPTEKALPVVRDEQGRPVLDASGKPMLMGEGSISQVANYNSDVGLTVDGVVSGVSDQLGNLWFGTPGAGINKFDGTDFVNITVAQGLVHSSITSILQDKAGNLWFSTDGGVSCYDGWGITNFTVEDGLGYNLVKCIYQDKQGNLWFGTSGGGVSRYNPDPKIKAIKQRFTTYTTKQGLTRDEVLCIYEDQQGYIWVGTSSGACKFDPAASGKSSQSKAKLFYPLEELADKAIRSIAEDKKGNLWLATNNGLYKYDGKTFTRFSTKQGLVGNNINHLTCDPAGNLWISVRNAGVSKYDGTSFANFSSEQGLSDKDVMITVLSQSGTPWFGVTFASVSKYNGTAFTKYTVENGLVTNGIFTIIEDKAKNLWLGSQGSGMSRFDGRVFSNYNANQGLASNGTIAAIRDSLGNLWFGTQNGMYHFDGKAFTYYSLAQGLPSSRVNWVTIDHNNILWMATQNGLVKFDGRNFTTFTTKQGLSSNYLLSLAPDKQGNLWIGTLGSGVIKFDGHSFSNYSTEQGLVYNDVYSITCDRSGNIWFGTDGGVSRISNHTIAALKTSTANKSYKSIFDNLTTANGLADNVLYDIEEDLQGNVMIGTNLGITLIPAEAKNLPFDQVLPKLEYYNIPNGYPIKDVNTSALYCDSKGYMWIGTSKGLFRFDYSSIPKNKVAPSLVLEKIKVNEQDVCWYTLMKKGIFRNQTDSARAKFAESTVFGTMLTPAKRDTFLHQFKGIRVDSVSRFYPIPQKLLLPHQYNHLTIQFKAIETDKPEQLQYQYLLEGYDKNWSQPGQSTVASFGNMSAGRYTFKVRVRRGNGDWSMPLTYAFRVAPPWYASWWAYLAYALLFGLTLRSFIRWRNNTLLKEKEKLEKAVQERTAELSQKLDELATVNQVSSGLVSQLHLDDLFKLVGDEMRRLFKANIVYIAVHDKPSDMIHFPYEYGDSTPSRKFGNGLTEKIIRSKSPLLLNEDSSVRNKDLNVDTLGQISKSYLGVPIIAADEVIGVLSVQSTQQENRFKEDDLRLLNTIAANVGVAMHNAQLFDDAQQARAQAEEANEAKSTFLSTISHELRTPLTSVIGFAKIIAKRLEERIFPLLSNQDTKVQGTIKQVSDNLKVVISEGERLTTLINDVLDLAKIEAGRVEWKMEEVHIPDLIQRAKSVTTSLFAQKNLQVELEVPNDLPTVTADHDRILQVMINLLSNAVKFTEKGSVTVHAKVDKGAIVVGITDTGIGIALADQAKVFEKFKQAGDTLTDKPKGTGLGLPICKEIVEHHGGQLWLESEVGQGSTFYFSLPLKTAGIKPFDLERLMQQLREQVGTGNVGKRNGPAEILVVDDELHIRELLRQELSEAGYQVLEASNGREAIEVTRQQHPDLIILDVMMPEMNGFDVAAVLKNDPKTLDIPILILSIVQDQERGYRLGIDRYLTKPIDTEKLFAEVHTLIGQGKSQKKVMVVDENSTTLKTLSDVLQERGYQVVESNGAELLEKALSDKPDIIILSSKVGGQQEVVKTLRFERGMENVLFLVYE